MVRSAGSAAALLACVGIAACGSSSSTTSNPISAQEQARINLGKCFREHGVNIPGIESGGTLTPSQLPTNVAPSVIEAAFAACRQYAASAGVSPTSSGASSSVAADQAVKYAECLRQHGIDVPVPNGEGSGFGQAVLQARSNPAFAAANSACERLLPQH